MPLQRTAPPAKARVQNLKITGSSSHAKHATVVPPDAVDTTKRTDPTLPLPLAPHGGLSKPLEPLGAARSDVATSSQARRDRWKSRRCGTVLPTPRFAFFVLDGIEHYLASLRFVNTSPELTGVDHPAFAALKAEYADVLGAPPQTFRPIKVSSWC